MPPAAATAALDVERLGQLGRATEALLGSLDASVGGAFRTPDSLFFGDRAASGWTVRLALVLAVVPFALGRRRPDRSRTPALAPVQTCAASAARRGSASALLAGALVWLGALAGVFPTGAPLPLATVHRRSRANPRRRADAALRQPSRSAGCSARRGSCRCCARRAEERLAGLASALAALGVVAVALALRRSRTRSSSCFRRSTPGSGSRSKGGSWRRVVLFGVGLAGPILALLLLGNQLGLVRDRCGALRRRADTVGYVPLGAALLGLAWVARPPRSAPSRSGATRPTPAVSSRRPPVLDPAALALAR